MLGLGNLGLFLASASSTIPDAPVIANQPFSLGALTAANVQAVRPVNTGGTVTSASIDSGNSSGHFAIASNGRIYPTSTGDDDELDASPYVLGCTFTNAAGSDTAIITITTAGSDLENTAHVTSDAEAVAMMDRGISVVVKHIDDNYTWLARHDLAVKHTGNLVFGTDFARAIIGDYLILKTHLPQAQYPAWDGVKHGTAINPVAGASHQPYYDCGDSYYYYSASERVNFPISAWPDAGSVQSLVCTHGLPDAPLVGGANDMLVSAAVFTYMDALPASPAITFRPPYCAGNKYIKTTADVNYGLLSDLVSVGAAPTPSLPPAGATFGEGITYLWSDTSIGDIYGALPCFERVWLNHGKRNYGSVLHPQSAMPTYGRNGAEVIQRGLLYINTRVEDAPLKVTVANRLLQQGLDWAQIAQTNGAGYTGGAGFGKGVKSAILAAATLFEDSDLVPDLYVPVEQQEGPNNFKFEDTHMYYGAETSAYPAGLPNWGQYAPSIGQVSAWGLGTNPNHDDRDPAGLLYPEEDPAGGGTYRFIASPWTPVASFIARLMDFEDDWAWPPFHDYASMRWMDELNDFLDAQHGNHSQFSRDVYGVGGTGSEWVVDMYEAYGPAVLKSLTDAADGSDAATCSVSANVDDGTLYWVVTQSDVLPTAAQVIAGTDENDAAADASGNQAVSATGAQNFAPASLTASTGYFTYAVHVRPSGVWSSVVTGDGFTTGSASTPYSEASAGPSEGQNALVDTYAWIDRSWALDNGATITHLGLFSQDAGTFYFQIVRRNGANDYTEFYTEPSSLSHTGGGEEQLALTTPQTIPGSGDYYVVVLNSSGSGRGDRWTTDRSYLGSGFVSGNNQFMNEDNGNGPLTSASGTI